MKKILLVCLSLLLCLSGEAQEMKGRIYFNGNMSVSHLLAQKENETAEQHKERETVMNEIFTMTVTIEFLNSHDMRMKMKILILLSEPNSQKMIWLSISESSMCVQV